LISASVGQVCSAANIPGSFSTFALSLTFSLLTLSVPN
jgi:hypothetical protein